MCARSFQSLSRFVKAAVMKLNSNEMQLASKSAGISKLYSINDAILYIQYIKYVIHRGEVDRAGKGSVYIRVACTV